MAEQNPKPKDFPSVKGDKEYKKKWDDAAGKRSISFLFRVQQIEDIFIESCLKHSKTHLIGEEVCDVDLADEYWTTIRNVQDISKLDTLVKKAFDDIDRKIKNKFKFDLYLSPDDVRIDHLDSSKFNGIQSHTKKVWRSGAKTKRRVPKAVSASKTPARTEEHDETDEVESKKARRSYAEFSPTIKSIGVLFQDRVSQNLFWKKCQEHDALRIICSLAACDPDEPTSFFVRINKPELGITYLEQLFKSAMAEFTLAIMGSGGQSGGPLFDVMLETDKESIRKNDQNAADFDLKRMLQSI